MPSRVTLAWNGDRIRQRVHTAARLGVNATVDAARDDAKATHEEAPWFNRPTRFSKEGGQLESEIISEHADPSFKGNPAGSFGTARKRGFYGLFHELGTVHEYERPFLRPAADREFPGLADRIRRRLKR